MKVPAATALLLGGCVQAAPPPPYQATQQCIAGYLALLKPASPTIDTIDSYRTVCENLIAGQYRLQTTITGERIYSSQIVQNTVMLWMVVTITVAGVILAGLQLWATYRLAAAGTGTGALADGGEVTMEHNRLVVRSSVVGVVILGLSFAFFALYVLYVYRLQDLPGLSAPAPRPTAGAVEMPR